MEAQSSNSARALLDELFQKCKNTSERPPMGVLYDIRQLCGIDTMHDLMRSIDPERKVFESPPAPDELGHFGLPLFDNVITSCSSIYTTDLSQVDERIPSAFADLVEEGFLDGPLHGAGILAWHNALDVYGFLVMVPLACWVEPQQTDVDALAVELGLHVACYSDPTYQQNSLIYLTALVQMADGLSSVPRVLERLQEIEDKWELVRPG